MKILYLTDELKKQQARNQIYVLTFAHKFKKKQNTTLNSEQNLTKNSLRNLKTKIKWTEKATEHGCQMQISELKDSTRSHK